MTAIGIGFEWHSGHPRGYGWGSALPSGTAQPALPLAEALGRCNPNQRAPSPALAKEDVLYATRPKPPAQLIRATRSRLDVLLRVQSGRLRVSNACVLIGLQRRQVFRLLRGLKQDGATSLLSKHRGKPSNHRLPAEVRTLALSIVRERYADFGPTPAFAGAGSGGGEAGRASRLLGVARDLARLDDRRWTVAGPSAPSPLAASATPAARLPGRTGADRRLGARLVRGSRPAMHAAGFRGRRDEPVDAAAVRHLGIGV